MDNIINCVKRVMVDNNHNLQPNKATMKPIIINEASKIWHVIMSHQQEKNEITSEIEINKKLLNIFQHGEFYYYIFNLKTTAFDFLSPEISNILGYSIEEIDVSLILNSIHPEDQPFFLNFEREVMTFFAALSIHQIPNYKVSYDYRIKKKDGNYIRILQQVITINYDKDGQILKTLGVHTNISHIKLTGKPTLSFIGLLGEPSYYNVQVNEIFKVSDLQISKREREILCLLVDGEISKKIGLILNISMHTVNTHRRNLLSKTLTNNIAELITKAIKNGWV